MSHQPLAALGWDDHYERAVAGCGDDSLVPARVSRTDRSGCDTLTAAGPLRCTYGAGVLDSLPCTGDWIVARHWPDGRVTVERLLERRTLISRLTVAPGQSKRQPLAANVDLVFVTEGAVPDPDLGRIERLLAVVMESGACAVVVLTKADLAGPAVDVLVRDVADVAGPTPVHPVSAVTGAGLETLRGLLAPGRTVAMLGASGVGKSTLVNTMLGADVLRTAALRADGKGRHTTVARELVPVPAGGVLLDTPGLRSIGVNVATSTVDLVFTDIARLAEGCRFADCAHDVEPGCAVLAAVETGVLAERRLSSWRKLMREAVHEQQRAGAQIRAERRMDAKRKNREDKQVRARSQR